MKAFFSIVVIMGAIACNEEDDLSGIPPSVKNPISLSAKIDANETGEAMTRVSPINNFPNEAQVAVLAYVANNYNETLHINHEKADVVNNNALPYYYLAWQEGREQYWPDGQELWITAYNPLNTKDEKSNDKLKISLHPQNWEITPDVIAADPVTTKYLPNTSVDLSFHHIMSSLNIKMKSADENAQLGKVELSIEENKSARFYNLKTTQWEETTTTLTPSVNYLLSENISLSSIPINLSSTPILFFPGMEQFVRLTVYKKSPDGSYGAISMKLSDIKDNTGTPIPLLLPGVRSTLTLSLKSTMVFSVDNCSLQEWEVIDAGRATMHTEGEKEGQIEINVRRINPLDSEIYIKIQSIQIISGGKEYRTIVTSISPLTFSALTEKLGELPKFLDIQSQLIIYMTDNSVWKIPYSMYWYRYDENRPILTIDSEAFIQ
ncbi:hypothetical protein EZS27_012277 [termite gut metagenome]|uniref:Fimbrillin family protein n=1 Tax=termite gut metagenome TaxID=433724 RepID=A0A5J4S249_9ZZZZ